MGEDSAQYKCCVCLDALNADTVIKYAGRRFCADCHKDYTGLKTLTGLKSEQVLTVLANFYFRLGRDSWSRPKIDWDSEDPIGSNDVLKTEIDNQIQWDGRDVVGVAPKPMPELSDWIKKNREKEPK
tara:strand:- start:1287 stop:1667 length:381 start_codon:yes stop_codon:yes gene_type:complete